MTTPTRIIVDLATGQSTEVELSGAELEAYNASLAQQAAEAAAAEQAAQETQPVVETSTSSGLTQTADTSGTLELQSNGTTQITVSSTGAYGQLKSATAQAATSGTSIDFTSIPSWVKRITVMFSGVSTNGTSLIRLQLGDSGGIETTGYTSTSSYIGSSSGGGSSTSGFDSYADGNASWARSGSFVFTNVSGNVWVLNGAYLYTAGFQVIFNGTKTLSDTLDRVRITTVNGTDTFDAGSINIMYEG
jgi:hypothetical protein